jgi:hypothetical protein
MVLSKPSDRDVGSPTRCQESAGVAHAFYLCNDARGVGTDRFLGKVETWFRISGSTAAGQMIVAKRSME